MSETLGKMKRLLPISALGIASAFLANSHDTYAAKVLSEVPEDSRLERSAPKTAADTSLGKLKKSYKRPTSIPFPEDKPYTVEKARLGMFLFFDPRLSRSNMQSCASCHNPSFAWGDALAKGVGDNMKNLGRRTPTILNLAWASTFMWDGRKATLEDQALGPIAAEVEMNMPLEKLERKLSAIPEYKQLFEDAFPGNGKIKAENIAKAIATFERTIVSAVAPFDRWIEGDETAISESAKRGFALFNGKGKCSACHEGWRFTDDSFHDIGLSDGDIGRGAHLPEIEKMRHAFKTPGLRNIERRAPFMHDGSIRDLRGVVEHYNKGGVMRPSRADNVRPLGLTDREIDDVVSFMSTLSSKDRMPRYVELPR